MDRSVDIPIVREDTNKGMNDFEKDEKRMLEAVKTIESTFDAWKPLFPESLISWYLLENANLDDAERP